MDAHFSAPTDLIEFIICSIARSRISWSQSSVVLTSTEAMYPRLLPIFTSICPELTSEKIWPNALWRSPAVFGGERATSSVSGPPRDSPLLRPSSAARRGSEWMEQKPLGSPSHYRAPPTLLAPCI